MTAMASSQPTDTKEAMTKTGNSATWGITPLPFVEDDQNDLGRRRSQRVSYLEGLRGLVAIEVTLWIFFRLLIPAIATDTDSQGHYPAAFLENAPAWQHGLRKGLGPLFWDSTLPSAFFIILSGRVVSLTFLERRSSLTLAGAAFRRPFRMAAPIALALALSSIVLVAGGYNHADRLAELTGNDIARKPQVWRSTIEYFNSIVALFFNTEPKKTDTSTTFLPPAGLLWTIPVIFQQSFTAYVFSILLPYCTLASKLWGFAGFIVVMYWLGSWGWYTLTGLQLAEVATCYLGMLPREGLPLGKGSRWRLPLRLIPAIFLGLGVALKYSWASFPHRRNDEYSFHTRTSDGSLNRGLNDAVTPYPRVDDYLLAFGAMALLELSPQTQRIFANPILTFFGRISFTLFLVTGTVCLSLGSLVYVHLVDVRGWKAPADIGAVLFFSCVPTSALAATLGHFAVEEPFLRAVRELFDFMRKP